MINIKQNLDKKQCYRLNLERALLISLASILIIFHLFPKYSSTISQKKTKISLIKVIDLPATNKLKQPSPPPPVKIVEQTKISDKKLDTKSLKDEIQDTDIKLEISEKSNNELLLVDSQLGDVTSLNFSRRSFDNHNIGSLDLQTNNSRLVLNDGTTLSLESPKAKIEKKYNAKSIKLDTKSMLAEKKTKQKITYNQNNELDKIITIDKNQFLLRESESTIGTDEYKIWNRINASLDRLNKDRYGDLPRNVKRISNGLIVSFTYENRSRHDIFWSKGGKVIIRVTGTRSKHQIDELQKAYDALLQLIYKINITAS